MLNSIPYTVSHPGDESVNEESVKAVTPISISREPQVPLHHLSYLPALNPLAQLVELLQMVLGISILIKRLLHLIELQFRHHSHLHNLQDLMEWEEDQEC